MVESEHLKFVGKRLVLGVTGSIATYKAVGLLRTLVQEGADVQVAMTESAMRFVSPLTFEVLSGHPVAFDLFAAGQEMLHLTLSQQADAIVVAPATANFLARCALGLADDVLNAMLLAAACPVVVAPTMDRGMWGHPAVRAHTALLRERGLTVLEPEEGPLASGLIGRGRLPQESAILEAIAAALSPRRDLIGQRILVSAGPTQEAIDPVRFISNRSSGKMGYAIAQAARERGADVVLVSGPTALVASRGVEVVSVSTAEEMAKALALRFRWATVLVMAAAVADFRPIQASSQKLKKDKDLWGTLKLECTQDIIESLSKQRTNQVMVGFAAETEDLVSHATAKLTRKGLDLIVGNDVGREGGGFGSDSIAAVLIDRRGSIKDFGLLPKRELADRVLDSVLSFLRPPPLLV